MFAYIFALPSWKYIILSIDTKHCSSWCELLPIDNSLCLYNLYKPTE